MREILLASLRLLEDVDFDGPVDGTLRQFQEHWDGTGSSRGLKGGEILITARIVSVANAFVALLSPRAHRSPLDTESAIEALLAEVGKAYDRRVVVALINRLDNHDGRWDWAKFVQPAIGS